MNIIIIGGGRKLGKYLAITFESIGHQVFILSHKSANFNLVDSANHVYANFEDKTNIFYKFHILTQQIETIDIIVYCSTYQETVDHQKRFSEGNEESIESFWIKNLQANVIIPHELIKCSLRKMNENSKCVFFTTGITLNFGQPENDPWSHLAEYAGTKAAQNYLMKAFAKLNNRKSTFFSISTHFTEETVNFYIINHLAKWDLGSRIVNQILDADAKVSGKIVEIYQH